MKAASTIRTCVGCGQRDLARTMIRLARRSDGSLVVNRGGRERGRGGYLHRDENCWSRFARQRGTIRSFRAVVQPQTRVAVIDRLRSGVDL